MVLIMTKRIFFILIFLISLIFLPSGYQGLFSQPAQTPWPMFDGSARHTGYSPYLGPQKNTLKWKTQLIPSSQGQMVHSPSLGADGTIYIGASIAAYALDPNGNIKWSKALDMKSVAGSVVSSDGTIYFTANNGVVAYDTSGNEKWTYKTGGMTLFGPTIGSDGTIYQGSWDGYLYALNPDGTLKWKFNTRDYTPGACVSYPASIGPDNTIYLGNGDAHCGGDRNLYAINGSDGSLKWKYSSSSALRLGTPAIGPDGTIYVSASPDLLALNPSTNPPTLKWKLTPQSTPIPVDAGIIGPALSPDGSIYIGNSQGIFYCISTSGTVKWKADLATGLGPTADKGIPTWPIIGKDGTIYVGSVEAHKVFAINPTNGAVKWSYTAGGEISEAAPAIDSNGILYVGSEDGYLYAIGEDNPQSANNSPTSNAGADQVVTTGSSVTLDGSKSSDPDGDKLSYSWSFISRPSGSTASFSNNTVVNPSFTADKEGIYVIQLIVNDGSLSSSPDNLVINAASNAAVYISTDKSNYLKDDTLGLQVRVINPSKSSTVAVDAFIGIGLPDGRIFFLGPSLNLKEADPSSPRSFIPLVSNLNLPPSFIFPTEKESDADTNNDGINDSYRLFNASLAGFPSGNYYAFAALAEPGSVQAGSPKIVGDISISYVTYSAQ